MFLCIILKKLNAKLQQLFVNKKFVYWRQYQCFFLVFFILYHLLAGQACLAFSTITQSVDEDEEYKGNWGLADVHANKAYALGLTGKDIKIGILDHATDLNHTKFKDGKHIGVSSYYVHPDNSKALYSNGGQPSLIFHQIKLNTPEGQEFISQNEKYLTRFKKFFPALNNDSQETAWTKILIALKEFQPSKTDPDFLVYLDVEQHGTNVSGIIAAARNNQSMHGIAPQSTLVNVGDIQQDYYILQTRNSESNLEFSDNLDKVERYSAIIEQFKKHDVKVINYSFGLAMADPLTYEDLKEDYQTFGQTIKALAKAADYKMLSVWAMGNSGPSAYAGIETALPYFHPEFEPYWLTVVATDKDGKIADFSTHCGITQEWCLAAPGVNLLTPTIEFNKAAVLSNTNLDVPLLTHNIYKEVTGTSFAAPMVSGAIALLSQRFPYMQADQIREVILTTATDEGRPGVDEVYGHGKLNLAAAIQGPKRLRRDFYAILPADIKDIWMLDIDGPGGLIKGGAGTLTLTGINHYQGLTHVQSGQLIVNGQLNDSTIVKVDSGAWLRGTGTIASPTYVEGILAPGNSPGTLYFTASLNLSNQSHTQLDINGYGTNNGAGNYSRVIVSSPNHLMVLGGTLEPNLQNTNFMPIQGDRFAGVLISEAGFSGGFSSLTQPIGLTTNTRFDLIFKDNKQADLIVANHVLPGNLLGDNAQAGAEILNALRDQPIALRPGNYNTWLEQALNSNSNDLTYRLIGGQIYADTLAWGKQYQGQISQILFDRLAGFFNGKQSLESNYSLWIKTPYEKYIYTAASNRLNAETSFESILLGLDKTKEQMQIGAAISFADGRVEQHNADAQSHLTGFSLNLYGRYTFSNRATNNLYLSGYLSYAQFHMNTHRAIHVFNTTFNSHTDLCHLTAEIGTGKIFHIKQWRLNPELRLGWIKIKQGDINEISTHGEDFALTLNSHQFNSTYMTAQIRLQRQFEISKGQITPQFIIGIHQPLNRNTPTISAKLASFNNTIQQNAAISDRTLINFGWGVQLQQKNLTATFAINTSASINRLFNSPNIKGLGAYAQFTWGW